MENIFGSGVLIFDGAAATEFYRQGIFVNNSYENLNLVNPGVVSKLHEAYVNAGVNVLTTNSFGANKNKLSRFGLGDRTEEINAAAVKLARAAAEKAERRIYIAGSVGPAGESAGHGNMPDSREAVTALAGQIEALKCGGTDFILAESIPDMQSAQSMAAALSETGTENYMVSFALKREALSGLEEPENSVLSAMIQLFEKLENKPFAYGLNCGLGPDEMLTALLKAGTLTKLPLVVQPNSGTPHEVDNRIMYMCTPEYFTTYAVRYIQSGASGVGGCCGIGPEHILEMARAVKPLASAGRCIETVSGAKKDDGVEALKPESYSRLAAKLARGEFVRTVEITPPRGFDLSDVVAKARLCAQHGIDGVNLPDGPRASSRISSAVTAQTIQREAGIEAVLHVCGRDRNIIALQSDLLGCTASGVCNILFITGDPPKLGDYPFASGVFDLDSIGMLEMAGMLNRGLDVGGRSIGGAAELFAGAGADPNALDPEREFSRLRRKIEAGAKFIVTQPAFSKEPVLRMLDAVSECNIPVIAGIWPLASLKNAEFMKTQVPGVVVPDSVIRRMSKYSDRADQFKEGLAIAAEALEELRDAVAGVQMSAPFGRVDGILDILC